MKFAPPSSEGVCHSTMYNAFALGYLSLDDKVYVDLCSRQPIVMIIVANFIYQVHVYHHATLVSKINVNRNQSEYRYIYSAPLIYRQIWATQQIDGIEGVAV